MRPDSSSMAAPTLKFENGAWAFSRASSAACNRSGIDDPWEQRFQEIHERAAHAQAGFEHLLVVDFLRRDASSQVRYTGYREALHAAVVGDDSFRHRRHAS